MRVAFWSMVGLDNFLRVRPLGYFISLHIEGVLGFSDYFMLHGQGFRPLMELMHQLMASVIL